MLVVEDEDPLRQAVVKVLRKTGFRGTGGGRLGGCHQTSARERRKLLDMSIPGASSYEVVAEVARARPNIRVDSDQRL